MRPVSRQIVAVLSVLALPIAVASAGEGTPDPGYGVRGVSVLATGNADQSSGAAVAGQGDKAVIAGEALDNTGGGPRLRATVTRTNADGTRDAGFGTGGQTLTSAGTGDSRFYAVTIAPDGKIVAVGSAVDGGTEKILVVRFSADGVRDNGFGNQGVTLIARGDGGVAAGNAVLVEADGSVIVAGQALDGGITKMVRAKLNSGGVAQGWGGLGLTAVGADGFARANAIGKLDDGSYVLAGEAADGDSEPFLARVSASTGALTTGWGSQGDGISMLAVGTIGGAYGLTVTGSQIVITGAIAETATEVLAAAFKAGDGALDGSFGTGGIFRAQIGDGGSSIAHAITTDGSGRFLLAGEASQDLEGDAIFQFVTARLTPGGALDTSYNPSGPQPGAAFASAPGGRAAHGNGVALAADGKALLAGRVGDGPGESLATARFCTATAQPCFSASGDVALPPQSDLAMSEQCGTPSVTGIATLNVTGGYGGRVTVTVTSSNASLFSVSPAETLEPKADGPLRVNYTVTHHGNAADSATLTIRVEPEGRAAFTRTLTVRHTVLAVTAMSPATATTPRDRAPGSPITLTVPGIDICSTSGYTGGSASVVRVGNDHALANGTRAGDTLTVRTPRLATTGGVELATLDSTGKITARAAAPGQVMVDTYRNSLGFAFRNFSADVSLSDMVRAFGAEDLFICVPVPFAGCVPSGVPDPWALAVWGVLQLGNGSCFGFSWVSEWMRQGKISPASFNVNATTPFSIGGMPQEGDAPAVRPDNITDEVEAAWARQFSEEYMEFYRHQTLLNLVSETPSSLRATIEDMMRSGKHPLLSIRDGGTIGGLHVVTAYDVESDPNESGAYYIYVYDSNVPFDPADVTADGDRNSDRLAGTTLAYKKAVDSRIHVHADGSWQMPSSSFGGKRISNILAGPWDLPSEDARIISPATGVTAAVTLFIAWAGEGISKLGADGTEPTAPTTVTQITAGKRKLYTAPGVINTDPATKLDVVPWTLATGGPAPVEGQFIPAGAPYELKMRGDRNATQTQVVFGHNTVSKISAPVRSGVTDTIGVAPKQNSISFDPGAASAKVTLEMSGTTGNGGWRTASMATTTKGEDGLRFDRAKETYVIDHKGPGATVKLTLASTDKSALPQEATATFNVGRNQKVSLKPTSWKKLGSGRLVVRAGGKTRRIKLRVSSATKLTMGKPTTRVKGKARTARISITVPKGAATGSGKVTYVIRRGKRRIGNGTVSAGTPGRRTITIKLPASARRGDTLTLVGTAVRQRGTRYTIATATRTAKVR
ncbi:MAG TPA: delta-60 repeat domain-containing protein [Baekduia sp.]|uniref:delta-60 repeat domain-containing protein n=1 Tax=Baekduia sp. TaxID=2600305 RepID=UPI002C45ABB7|nr:delta-60 repeat domain-containing protein [Baekduia sp.]HMJ32619.1 delta-60 repeat domain-containing protein [Baekduia sp.]